MRDAGELIVQGIYDKAWKVGRVEPLGGEPVSLDHFLDVVREMGVRVCAEPNGEVRIGPHADGRVVAVDTGDGRLYYIVPVEAFPLMGNYLSPSPYSACQKG